LLAGFAVAFGAFFENIPPAYFTRVI